MIFNINTSTQTLWTMWLCYLRQSTQCWKDMKEALLYTLTLYAKQWLHNYTRYKEIVDPTIWIGVCKHTPIGVERCCTHYIWKCLAWLQPLQVVQYYKDVQVTVVTYLDAVLCSVWPLYDSRGYKSETLRFPLFLHNLGYMHRSRVTTCRYTDWECD